MPDTPSAERPGAAVVLGQLGVAALALSLILPPASGVGAAAGFRGLPSRAETPHALGGELAMAAAILLSAALLRFLAHRAPRSAAGAVAAGAAGVAIVLDLVAMVAQGRLVSPIIGLETRPAEIPGLLALWLGAVHALVIACAVAIAAVAIATRRTLGMVMAVLGVLAAAVLLLASFPWMAPSWVPATAVAIAWAWTIAALAHPGARRALSAG